MADRIAVLNHGVLQQCDTPDVVYDLPANRFVATVVGSPPTNFIPAEVTAEADDLVITHPVFKLRAEGGAHPLRAALGKDGRSARHGARRRPPRRCAGEPTSLQRPRAFQRRYL